MSGGGGGGTATSAALSKGGGTRTSAAPDDVFFEKSCFGSSDFPVSSEQCYKDRCNYTKPPRSIDEVM